MSDLIDHPPHYNQGKIEVIDFIEDQGLSHGFCLGNAIKYITRAGAKDGVDPVVDLEKAVWYLKREIEIIKAEREDREPVRPNAMNPKSESFSATPVSISNPTEAPTGVVENVFDPELNVVWISREWIRHAIEFPERAGFIFPIKPEALATDPASEPPKAEMRKVDFNFKGHWTEVNTTDQESYVVFLPQGEFSDLAHLIDSDAEVMGVLIPDGLECPKCSRSWAGNSEQAESIRLKGECLGCLTKLPDPLAEPIIPPSNW